MEYFYIFYYLSCGVSVAFFMNKVGRVNWVFAIIVSTTWPIILPFAALALYIIDRSFEERGR